MDKKHDDMADALDRIRREINRQGWSQKNIADVAGVSQGLISKWMQDRVMNPRYDKVVAVAQALGIRVRLLLTRGRE